MPWSDEGRLERVYRRAHAIRLARRFRAVALGVSVVLAGVGVAAALATPGASHQTVAAGGGPSTTIEAPTTTVVPLTIAPPPTRPTVITVPPTAPPVTSTTVPATPQAKWCVYGRGQGYRSVVDGMPAAIAVTVTVTPATVRLGDPVTVTITARNTTDQPLTYDRGTVFNSVEVRPTNDDLQVAWERYLQSGDPNRSGAEHFDPGEQKTEQVVWRSGSGCDGTGSGRYKDGVVPPGRYQIEASWDTRWHDPVYVDVLP